MKNIKPLIYLLILPFSIISILFVITLASILYSENNSIKELLSMTGTLGDTLGGITTCLISGLTLYYIITSFKDQSSINEHSKSSNNFGIYYDLLSKIENKIVNLENEYRNQDGEIEKRKGLDAINLFSQKIQLGPSQYSFLNAFNDLDFEFFKETTEILGDLCSFYESQNVLKLENEHNAILLKEFKRTFDTYFHRINLIDIVLNSKYNDLIFKPTLVNREIFNLNRLTPIYIKYQSYIDKIEKLGLVTTKSVVEQSTAEQLENFFKPLEIDEVLIKNIKTKINVNLI